MLRSLHKATVLGSRDAVTSGIWQATPSRSALGITVVAWVMAAKRKMMLCGATVPAQL